jgi:hypothetical protein
MANPAGRAEHVAAFYRDETFLITQMASFIADGLAAGDQIIVMATIPHWTALTARLERTGVPYGRAAIDGQLILLDAEVILEQVMVEGRASLDRLRDLLAPLLVPGRACRLYGELVSLLVERGDVDAAIAIEALGQELSRQLDMPILCGYHVHAALTPTSVRRIEDAHDRAMFEAGGMMPPRLNPA